MEEVATLAALLPLSMYLLVRSKDGDKGRMRYQASITGFRQVLVMLQKSSFLIWTFLTGIVTNLQFYLEEAKGNVDYQGYIFPRRRGESVSIYYIVKH